MNFVIVSGYICSGSSVVNDLLKEVGGYKDFPIEFKLFSQPAGILELENALFTDWDYMKTACALDRFEGFCHKLTTERSHIWRYDKAFCDEFEILVNTFIEEIAGEKYNCGSSFFNLENDKVIDFSKRGVSLSLSKRCPAFKKIRFCDISREEFYEAVQRLMIRLFEHYNKEGYHSVILDQGIPPHSVSCFENYFPNGKMIIVDRDPRDTALSMIQRQKGIGMQLKQKLDADLYIRWFKRTRNNGKKVDNPNVLYLTYEELILDYEKSRKKVFEFMEIDASEHKEQYQYFNPEISSTRIGKWKNYKNTDLFAQEDWLDFCEKIGEELKDFCCN